MASVPKNICMVSVRELVEFSLRTGSLGGEGHFTGPARARAGTRGHQQLQRSRGAGYQKEVSVFHDVEVEEMILRVQGRIDGVMGLPEQVVLEEIKTVQGPWDRVADPLHWAQARVYGFIYAHDNHLDGLTLQLTYLDLKTGEVTEFQESFSFVDLSRFFEQVTAIYLEWVLERHRWCQLRDRSIGSLHFPFPRYRPGQREFAVAAYRTLAKGGRLFLEAPTGIGKTMAVLFPALKALAEGKLERIFYLTARTVGRMVAEKALSDLRQAGLRLRSVTLTAKEKLCVQEGHPCDTSTCPFAIGYYDRLKPAMREALGHEGVTRAVLEAVARKHQVCPFELSLDLSVWVDALVCDYNYLFDPQVYLRRHFADPAGDYGFLVDEAHNLVDRGREMFSADLDTGEIRDVKRAIKGSVPRCAKALGRLSLAMRKLSKEPGSLEEPTAAEEASGGLDLFASEGGARGGQGSAARIGTEAFGGELGAGVITSRDWPEQLEPLLQGALQEAEAWLGQNQPAAFREDLLGLYFRIFSFLRTAELYDERFVTIIEPGSTTRVRLFCLDPSYLLRQALERGKAAVFFSATLTPIDYFRSLLGGDPEDPALRLCSPFPPENLAVLVQDQIRTQLNSRAETLEDVVAALGALVDGRRGNYLVYFPSYQYLKTAQEQFQVRHPAVRVLAQRPGMTEPAREEFLTAFASEPRDTLVGFAVMGGIFGEGIDLVGDRLIGAAVVGVGLPQLSVERELIRRHFQEKTGMGYEYAYLFPGMNRVLQATGRVIRSETDRGVVLLVDTRFGQKRYLRLFPAWWRPMRVRGLSQTAEAVRCFWEASC